MRGFSLAPTPCAGAFAGRREGHAEGRHPHPGRPREAQGGDRVPLDGEAPRGRRAHQGGARVRRHLRELRVRRRQERAGDARAAHRRARGQAALRPGHRPVRAELRRRARRLRRHRHRRGPGEGQVAHLLDRRLDRGRPERQPALQRVAGRQGAARHKRNATVSVSLPNGAVRELKITKIDVGCSGGPARAWPRPATKRRTSSPRAARKLDALRAEGIDPFPHAYPGRRADRGGQARRTPSSRRARTPTRAPASRGAWPPAAGRAGWPSSTSSTARGASSCRPRSTCWARSASPGSSRSTSAT